MEVPGVCTYPLRFEPGAAHAFFDLVKIPAADGHPGGLTPYEADCPAHQRLPRYSLMVDSGAESSLIAERDRGAICRDGGFAGNAVIGIGGRMEAIGGGVLDFVFPGHRVKPLDAKAVLQWANTAPSGRSAWCAWTRHPRS